MICIQAETKTVKCYVGFSTDCRSVFHSNSKYVNENDEIFDNRFGINIRSLVRSCQKYIKIHGSAKMSSIGHPPSVTDGKKKW